MPPMSAMARRTRQAHSARIIIKMLRCGISRRGGFLKKAAQKLLLLLCPGVATPQAKVKKSLFAFFSSEKEVLSS
jgi:hypothetical protein